MFSTRFRFGFVFAAALCVALAGCGDDDDPTGPGPDVYGVWELNEPETVYIHVRPEAITVYNDQPSECFEVVPVTILSREGDTFTVNENGSIYDLVIRREGDGLLIILGEAATYTWAGDTDLDDLERC